MGMRLIISGIFILKNCAHKLEKPPMFTEYPVQYTQPELLTTSIYLPLRWDLFIMTSI